MSGGRLCPRCSTLIESGSAIFCYNCGQELKIVSEVPVAAAAFSEPRPSDRVSVRRHRFPFFFLFCFGLLPVSIFFLSFYLLWPGYQKKLPPTPTNDFVSTISALPLTPLAFGGSGFAGVSPAETGLYLEGGNLEDFLRRFLSPSQKEAVEARLGLNLNEAVSFFEDEFAFVRSASGSALLAVTRDPIFVSERIKKMKSRQDLMSLETEVLSGPESANSYLLVSDSPGLFAAIKETFGQKHLSLQQTAPFLETLKKLASRGQLLLVGQSLEELLSGLRIYFGSSLEAAATSLSGTAVVVDVRGGNVVLEGIYDRK